MTMRCFHCRRMIRRDDVFLSPYSQKPLCQVCHDHIREDAATRFNRCMREMDGQHAVTIHLVFTRGLTPYQRKQERVLNRREAQP